MSVGRWRWAAALALGLGLSGCISVYQPLNGLHRPVAIDTRYANFEGLNVDLRCLTGEGFEEDEAQTLCRRLSRLLQNQGATVRTAIRGSRVARGAAADEAEAEGDAPRIAAGPRRDAPLSIELRSRILHKSEFSLLFIWTFVTDYSFAQDITVRDADGALLIEDTLMGRFTQRFGFGEEASERFSRDYYRFVSQLTHNARMRQRVLVEAR